MAQSFCVPAVSVTTQNLHLNVLFNQVQIRFVFTLCTWTLRCQRGCFCNRVQCTAGALSAACARMCEKSRHIKCQQTKGKIVRRFKLRLLRERVEEYFLCDHCLSEQYSVFLMCVCIESICFQSRRVIVSSGEASVALASKDRNKEAETHCWCYQSLSVGDHTTELFFVFSVLDYQFLKQARSHSDSSKDFNNSSELKKKSSQQCDLVWCFLCLLFCPSEAR